MATAASVKMNTAAASAKESTAPKMAMAKGGWRTQTYIRGEGSGNHGHSYTMWAGPSGKRRRARKSAVAAGFVG
eukprot:3467750-Pyramimonas_sp.AAC.1